MAGTVGRTPVCQEAAPVACLPARRDHMDVGVRMLEEHLAEYLERAARGNSSWSPARGGLCFLTFDVRQAQAARSLGFTVVGS